MTDHETNQALLLSMIRALDEKTELQINALKEALTQQISAQKEGVKVAMDAAEKAAEKASTAADRRFEGLNELRGMVADWRGNFAPLETVDLQIKGVNDKIDELRNQVNALVVRTSESAARGSGRGDIWGFIVGSAGIAAALASVFVLLFRH